MISETPSNGSSRRQFLKGVGATGSVGRAGTAPAAVGASSQLSPGRYARRNGGAPASSVDFGRIFPNLPPFAEANDTMRAALIEVGQQGGILDGQDDPAAGPRH
jgi:hypothetical protein